MTEEQLAEIRQRIQEIEDQDFARKANTLLDEIISTNQTLDALAKNVDAFIEESRRDREADRERIGLNEMRNDAFRERILLQDERFDLMQVNFQTMQQNIERILLHLENQYPGNGKGEANQ